MSLTLVRIGRYRKWHVRVERFTACGLSCRYGTCHTIEGKADIWAKPIGGHTCISCQPSIIAFLSSLGSTSSQKGE